MKKIFFILAIASVLFGCGSGDTQPQPQPQELFVIKGTSYLDSAGDFQFDLTSEATQLLTFPAKFAAENAKGQNEPAYLIKLLKTETSVESTAQADWASNTGELKIDYTPSPPDAGDVILYGGASVGGIWAERHNGGYEPTGSTMPKAVLYGNSMFIYGGYNLDAVWEFGLSTLSWTQRSSSGGPGALGNYAPCLIVYNGRMYQYGGDPWDANGKQVNSFSLTAYTWRQDHDGTGTAPAPRWNAASVLRGNAMVVFGGSNSPATTQYNDLWSFNLDTNIWTRLHDGSGTAPAIRAGCYYCYDSATDRLIIFGGSYTSPNKRSDTWAFDFGSGTWMQLHDGSGTAPSGRSDGVTVLFNNSMWCLRGTTGGSADGVSTVWAFNLISNTWTQKTSAPGVRQQNCGVLKDGKVFQYGGYDGSSGRTDVWEDFIGYEGTGYLYTKFLDLGAPPSVDGIFKLENLIPSGTSVSYSAWAIKEWQNMTPVDNYVADRFAHSLVTINGKVYLYGGYSGSYSSFGDVWEFDVTNKTWTGKDTGPQRGMHSAVVHNNKMYVFGGDYYTGPTNEVWEFNPAASPGSQWTRRHDGTGTAPSVRSGHDATAVSGKMYIFGGSDWTPTFYNDVWEFNLTSFTWVRRHDGTGTAPSVRAATCSGNAPSIGKWYIFGGENASSHFNDVWAFNLIGFTWAQVHTGSGTAPSVRSRASAIITSGTPVSEAMLMFGGYDGTDFKGDIWRFDFAVLTWVQIDCAGSPTPPIARATASATKILGGIFIVGGWEDSGAIADVWLFGTETSLGTVYDGDAITVRTRYYRIKAELNTNTMFDATPTLRSAMVRFPDYIIISDHASVGYPASILAVSAISSNIDLFKDTSVGQITIKIALTSQISTWLKTYYPNNKEVIVKSGFNAAGWTEFDYIPYFTGSVENWGINADDTVSLTVRDFQKEWDVPVPAKWNSAGDNKTWTAMHHVDVMLDILRGYIGITDSKIDQNSFNLVKLATPTWVVTRTITGNTIGAKTLLEELRRALSAFFIAKPDGRIALKRWDASEAAVRALTDVDLLTKTWDANAAALINRTVTYFNHDGSTSDDLANFASIDIGLDNTSIANWKETATQEIKDKWTKTAQLAQVQDAASKALVRYANAPEIIPIKLDRRHLDLEVADIVTASTLRAPSTDMLGITNARFQIISKTPDFKADTLDMKLLRV